MRPCGKDPIQNRGGGVAEVLDCLPSKCEAKFKPHYWKKKKKERNSQKCTPRHNTSEDAKRTLDKILNFSNNNSI
jgi:hypothetical protein